MIFTWITAGVSCVVGVVIGVALREHDILTLADLKASAERLAQSGKATNPKPPISPDSEPV